MGKQFPAPEPPKPPAPVERTEIGIGTLPDGRTFVKWSDGEVVYDPPFEAPPPPLPPTPPPPKE